MIVIMDISFTNQAMMLDRMDLGEEISQVFDTRTPKDFELAVFDAILDPVVSHGSRLESTDPNGLVCSR